MTQTQHTKASQVLDTEHEVIHHLLDAMDGMADRLDASRDVPRADVDAALDVVVGFADKCHHAKEEKVLFGALRDQGHREALRVVRELEGDHKAARKLVQTMRGEAAAGESHDQAQMRKLAHDARLYTKMLRAHIDHETTRLLPLIDQLPSSTRMRVEAEMDRIEDEEMGAGTHERYEGMVHELHLRYAPKGSSSASLSHHH